MKLEDGDDDQKDELEAAIWMLCAANVPYDDWMLVKDYCMYCVAFENQMCLSTHYAVAVTVVDAAGVVVADVVVVVVDVFAGDVVDGVNVGVVVVVVVFAVAVVVDDEDLSDDVCNEVEFGQEMLR